MNLIFNEEFLIFNSLDCTLVIKKLLENLVSRLHLFYIMILNTYN